MNRIGRRRPHVIWNAPQRLVSNFKFNPASVAKT
jgi:hypothetical protein